MLISNLPDEIFELTFKELIPPFRSEGLTEIYVFTTPIDLLRLRLVSKRFCRIATPLAWRRIHLRISNSKNLGTREKWWWSESSSRRMSSLSCGDDDDESGNLKGKSIFPSNNRHLAWEIGNLEEWKEEEQEQEQEQQVILRKECGHTFKSSHTGSTPAPPPGTVSFSPDCRFFRDHPRLAAHVRVLLLSLEYQIEGSGSGSGSGSNSGSEFDYRNGVGSRRLEIEPSSSSTSASASSSSTSSTGRDLELEYTLRATTYGMSSLRTVLVWDTAERGTSGILVQEVMSLFLRAPLLKVLSLRDVDGSAFPITRISGSGTEVNHTTDRFRLPGLKMLHLSNTRYPARAIASTTAGGSLEVLSIELARPCPISSSSASGDSVDNDDSSAILIPTLRDMPWSTLKEVSLVDCVDEADWNHFLDGFQLHKSYHLQSDLTELMIGDLAGLDRNRLTQLLNTFSCQPLTKLTLFHIPQLDPYITTRIIHSFPNLKHLTLLTEGELVPWPGVLDDYAQKLALLPYLDTFGWNNFHLRSDGAGADADGFFALSEDSLATLYARSVNGLVKRAKRLKCVKFISSTDCVVDTVFIGKPKPRMQSQAVAGQHPFTQAWSSGFFGHMGFTGSSSPPRLLTVRRSTKAVLHTSSWDTTSNRFDDA